MALVNVVNMAVLDNPTTFTSPFQFEITFECLQELDDDLEWKVLYVGSAQDATRDQILDEILVGPIPVGVNKFVLEADAPDPSQLAQDDLLGVTVVLVTCSYKEREFVRVGYYVNNEYHDPNAPPPPAATVAATEAPASAASTEQSNIMDGSSSSTTSEAPATPGKTAAGDADSLTPTIPNPVPLEHIQRHILADKPRVTKFPISWGDEQQTQQQQQQQQQHQEVGKTTDNNNNDVGVTSTAVSMMTEASSMMALPPASPAGGANVTPPGSNINNTDSSMMMMDEDDDDELDEDDDDDEIEENDDDAGVVSSSGIVSMPEESNMSHSYFHDKNANGGVQAMAE